MGLDDDIESSRSDVTTGNMSVTFQYKDRVALTMPVGKISLGMP